MLLAAVTNSVSLLRAASVDADAAGADAEEAANSNPLGSARQARLADQVVTHSMITMCPIPHSLNTCRTNDPQNTLLPFLQHLAHSSSF